MRKVVMALTLGAVFAAALTGSGCVRHWDDDHNERYEHDDDDRHEGHEHYEHRS